MFISYSLDLPRSSIFYFFPSLPLPSLFFIPVFELIIKSLVQDRYPNSAVTEEEKVLIANFHSPLDVIFNNFSTHAISCTVNMYASLVLTPEPKKYFVRSTALITNLR